MIQRVLLGFVFIISFASIKVSMANELILSLSEDTSGNHQGYYYQSYEFATDGTSDSLLTMVSNDLDSYILVIDPLGDIYKNDDHNKIEGLSRNDAGILINKKIEGKWVVVFTTSRQFDKGSFIFRHKGIGKLKRIEPKESTAHSIKIAFKSRGVLSKEDRRLNRINTLVDQLSIRSSRKMIREKLRANINKYDEPSGLDEMEQRELELQAALADTEKIPSRSKGLIKKVLGKELKKVQSTLKKSNVLAVRKSYEHEAYQVALNELDTLENVAISLENTERTLLEVTEMENMNAVRADFLKLRAEYSKLKSQIAEKIVDSNILSLPYFLGDTVSGLSYSRALKFRRLLGVSESIGTLMGASIGKYSKMGASIGKYSNKKLNASVWLTNLLPWPPPNASARSVLNRKLLTKENLGSNTLNDVNSTLTSALKHAGYRGYGYLGVPNGFAIVSRIEQTDSKGVPLDGRARWSVEIESIKRFSLTSYLQALITAPEGYFRVVALVASSDHFSNNRYQANLLSIQEWSDAGLNVLPREIGLLPFTKKHNVTALVYEFEKETKSDDPRARVPGRLTVYEHFLNTELSEYLL